jgi:hypothetical protein
VFGETSSIIRVAEIPLHEPRLIVVSKETKPRFSFAVSIFHPFSWMARNANLITAAFGPRNVELALSYETGVWGVWTAGPVPVSDEIGTAELLTGSEVLAHAVQSAANAAM